MKFTYSKSTDTAWRVYLNHGIATCYCGLVDKINKDCWYAEIDGVKAYGKTRKAAVEATIGGSL